MSHYGSEAPKLKLRISLKIIIIAAAGVVISSVITLTISTILMDRLLTRTIHEDMLAMQAMVARIQHQEEIRLQNTSQLLSTMPGLVDAVHVSDVERIEEIAQMSWHQLGLDSVTFTDASGVVLARGHSDIKGDDISGRLTMPLALAGRSMSGIFFEETAMIPYAIRSYTPIFKDGVQVGVLTLASDIGTDEYVDILHEISGMHFSLFKGDTYLTSSMRDEHGRRISGAKTFDQQVAETVLGRGETAIFQRELLGEPSMKAFWPVKDFEGNIIGMWAIAKSLSGQNLEAQRVFMVVVTCSLGIILLLVLAAAVLGRKIATPIRSVTDYAIQVAGGNLDAPLDVRSGDEVELLVGALNTMVSTLNERIQEVECLNASALQDIAEKKMVMLRDELQLLKLDLMVKATGIGLWDMEVEKGDPVNPENVFTWSDGFRRLLGYKDESDFPNVLCSWSSRIHPDDVDTVLNAFKKHIMDTTGNTPYDVEYRMIKKNGMCAYYRDSGDTIRDENGCPVRVAGSLIEITEQKRLLQDLETEKTMFQSMFDSVPDLIFCKDTDLTYTRCNESLLRHFGRSWEDVVGKGDEDGLGVTEEKAREFKDMDRKVIDERKIITFEEYIPAPSGKMRLYETSKVPLILGDKVMGIMGIARDITERKAMEEAARNANKAKSDFLSAMSHEIRTPMNAILGVTEIELHKDGLEPASREALEKIYASGDLLLGIINDILDLSRIESGKLELNLGMYEIASLVSDTAQINMMRIGSKRIAFELHIDEHMPAQLVGDELRIKQILNNLLSNAFKYTDSGTVKLSVCAEAGQDGSEAVLVIRVSDTGQGMTEEQLSMLFDEYSRFNRMVNRETEGVGLGMSITRNLVRLMGGDISVESKLGVGTEFTVRLPQGAAGPEELGKEMADNLRQFRTSSRSQMRRTQITRDPMPYGNVLVVDDVETNLYVAKGLLTPYELKIDLAGSGADAIKKAEQGKVYDIIFMDHMMPKMDGIEATQLLRSMGYDRPIVALTANAVSGQAGMFLNNGFDDFISKPIDLRQLNMLLNKYIRDKQPPEVVEAARAAAKPGTKSKRACPVCAKIEGLDIARGLEQFDGDEVAYVKILRSYAANVRSMLMTIETVDEDSLADYKITVHGIKGTSYYIFADQVGKLAEALETASAAGDLDYVREHNMAFHEATWKLIGDLEDMLRVYDSEHPKPIKIRPDAQSLAKLLDACRRYDMDDVDAAMAEIEQYQYEADDGLALWLRGAADMMELQQIADKLDAV